MDDNPQGAQEDAQKLAQMGQELSNLENKAAQTATPPTPPPLTVPPTQPATPSSPESISPASPAPTPSQKTNMLLWISVGILALAAIAGGVYYFSKGLGSGQTPVYTLTPQTYVTPSPAPVDRTAAWQLYINTKYNFSFKYPAEAKVQQLADGPINVQQLGPTQKQGTEIIDALNLSFKAGTLGTQTLQTFVNKKMLNLSETFQLSATSSATIAQTTAYKFHAKGLSEGDYYYLPLGTTIYLEIIDSTKDPTGKGFEQEAQDILSTLALSAATPSATPLATPVSTPSGTMGD